MTFSGFLAVGVGAALGAWLRWLLSLAFNPRVPWLPLGTLAANWGGGYLMGLAMGWIAHAQGVSPEWRLLVTTGFLGGLTTFSTFSAETIALVTREQYGAALTVVALHLGGSLLLTWLGLLSFNALRS
ncbi:fluoride efflux transporter CrcB [Solimonas variicoloris]|uniref:fluoride efflux transporter CrcB n=1 Tax=Solimonas variicoloris TaxID=254408 RepID=UPI00039A296F|nr:fluoride efflux transporter CrcB [Solimonas variicoloris]